MNLVIIDHRKRIDLDTCTKSSFEMNMTNKIWSGELKSKLVI